MAKNVRVSLIDPILYKSSYINKKRLPPITTTFWKKFNFLNFLFNVLLPISVIVFVLFVLKDHYINKKMLSKRKRFSNLI